MLNSGIDYELMIRDDSQPQTSYCSSKVKNYCLVLLGLLSGLNYWAPPFEAASKITPIFLPWVASISGFATNAAFNIQSYLELSEGWVKLRRNKSAFGWALIFSTATALPEFILNAKNSRHDPVWILIYFAVFLLNVPVYMEGTVKFYDSFGKFFQTDSDERPQYIEMSGLQAPPMEQQEMLPLADKQKPLYYTYFALIAVLFSAPAVFATSLTVYLGTKDLVFSVEPNNILAAFMGIVALVLFLPSMLGFTYGGVEKISLLLTKFTSASEDSNQPPLNQVTTFTRRGVMCLFFLLGLFSGFTSLDSAQTYYPRVIPEDSHFFIFGSAVSWVSLLSWLTNIGISLFFNTPQALTLAEGISQRFGW